ncbi:hypothetical protein BV25DRAFT_1915147 [Artomyces pyxidatus]|uniref:Uncharacterized protein n=1 Tax=Artomyces pyxidatus TaxID=48021 RepID=A0ACB8T5H3_9AGAM|nr:hypothetical protein BV25DRAFT_1915147 [Artomyces pyxidatus]
MSARADSATPTRLSTIRPGLVSRKLRVLGRVLCYDAKTATMVLCNEDLALPVDVSLCLPSNGRVRWLMDAWSTVSVFGYLEQPRERE